MMIPLPFYVIPSLDWNFMCKLILEHRCPPATPQDAAIQAALRKAAAVRAKVETQHSLGDGALKRKKEKTMQAIGVAGNPFGL